MMVTSSNHKVQRGQRYGCISPKHFWALNSIFYCSDIDILIFAGLFVLIIAWILVPSLIGLGLLRTYGIGLVIGYSVLFFVFLISVDMIYGRQNDGHQLFDLTEASFEAESAATDIREESVGSNVELGVLNEMTRLRKVALEDGDTVPASIPDCTLSPELSANHITSAYSYSPLLGQDIRLLRLSPSTAGSDDISCEMVTMPLSSAPETEYIALSYTWGDNVAEKDKRSISFGKQQIRIRPNLFNILQRICSLDRHLHNLPTGDLLLWVDAICIDQNNEIERGEQILRMQAIFASANQVLASIDLEGFLETKVLEFAKAIRPALGLKAQPLEVDNILRDKLAILAVAQLCFHKYWTRVWNLQEFAISQPLKLLINTTTIPLENVQFMRDLTFAESGRLRFRDMQSMLDVRASWQREQPMPLLSLLQRTSTLECCVRVDRVFGVLGLASDSMIFLQEPSYELDCNEWSILITKSYITNEGLCIILLGGGPQNRLNVMPSWCPDYFRFDEHLPDYRVFNIVLQSQGLSHMGRSPAFKGSRFWCATGRAPSQVKVDNQFLRSVARRIGVIRSLGAALSDTANSAYPKHDKEWARNCKLGSVPDLTYHVFLAARDLLQHDDQESFDHSRSWFHHRRQLYTYTHLFHTSHGCIEAGYEPTSSFAKWVYANRSFYTSGACLQAHAERIPHPIVYFWEIWKSGFTRLSTTPIQGFCAWAYNSLKLAQLVVWILYHTCVLPTLEEDFADFSERSAADMRLMCLDKISLGIGWAARSADLGDEVFLIPGCNVPVILRWHKTKGHYQFIGDAIVVGAMFNEIWSETKAEDLAIVEIG